MSGEANGGRANGTPREKPVIGYLTRVKIENIRSIASLAWDVTPGPGWNVVLGDNGSGKSTFLRAVAYIMLPHDQSAALRIDPTIWLREDEDYGELYVRSQVSSDTVAPFAAHASLTLRGPASSWEVERVPALDEVITCGFGPFRRFTGRDPEYDQQLDAFPRVARVASLFDERFTFSETLAWLRQHVFKELVENDDASKDLLHSLQSFINGESLLPNGVRLDRILPDTPMFVDASGFEVRLRDLSDGYRSMLSLVLTLVRHLVAHYGADHVFDRATKAVIAPGIVLIDEIEAHLHPTWQRQIGFLLRKHFPNIQFVVTTHSPVICEAATADTDTVYRLPRPGTDERFHKVTGAELDILLYGNLAEAYETEAIGLVGRSEKAQALLDRLGALNRKEIDVGLADGERKEQRRLRDIFPAALERRT